MSRRLEGQTGWISGAASGIGEATAQLFAAEGARVALVDVQADLGEHAHRAVSAAGGDGVFLACDVTREDQGRASIEPTLAPLGRPPNLLDCCPLLPPPP